MTIEETKEQLHQIAERSYGKDFQALIKAILFLEGEINAKN